MKRVIIDGARSINRVNPNFVRWNYEAVDAVVDQLEQIASEIEGYEDVAIEVDTHQMTSDFAVTCYVGKGEIETPNGNVVKVGSFFSDIVQCPNHPELDGSTMSIGSASGHLLRVYVSNSSYADAEIEVDGGGNLQDAGRIMLARIEEFENMLDNAVEREYDQKLQIRQREIERQQRRKDKALSQPVTLSNIGKVISAYRSEGNGSRVARKGDYLRFTSYEDDFVKYYDINTIIEELAADDINLGDALDDPAIIFDCSGIGEASASRASEVEEYSAYKREMNRKLGFSAK